jgi:hypothetical protein
VGGRLPWMGGKWRRSPRSGVPGSGACGAALYRDFSAITTLLFDTLNLFFLFKTFLFGPFTDYKKHSFEIERPIVHGSLSFCLTAMAVMQQQIRAVINYLLNSDHVGPLQ